MVFDAGYDVTRLAYLPAELLGALRSDRVLYFPAPPRRAGRGRPSRHGTDFRLAGEKTWPVPAVTTVTEAAHPPPDMSARDRPQQVGSPTFEGTSRRQDPR